MAKHLLQGQPKKNSIETSIRQFIFVSFHVWLHLHSALTERIQNSSPSKSTRQTMRLNSINGTRHFKVLELMLYFWRFNWIVCSIILWLELKIRCCAWLNFQVHKTARFFQKDSPFSLFFQTMERISTCMKKVRKNLTNKMRFFHMQKNFSNFIRFPSMATFVIEEFACLFLWRLAQKSVQNSLIIAHFQRSPQKNTHRNVNAGNQ